MHDRVEDSGLLRPEPDRLAMDEIVQVKVADDVITEPTRGVRVQTVQLLELLPHLAAHSEDRKKEKFKKEREEMMTATEQLIRRRKSKAAAASDARAIERVAPADVVKPMFDVTWGPIIGILSQVLELSNDSQIIKVCLNGFIYAVLARMDQTCRKSS